VIRSERRRLLLLLAGTGAGALVLAALPGFLSPFAVRVLQALLLGAGFASAWNILGGFAGYWSFGHSAFIGIGGFTAALWSEHGGFADPNATFAAAVLGGGLACALFAAVLGYPLLRLRGTYFSIAMLGVALVLSELADSLDVVEGATGISLPSAGPTDMRPEVFFYFVMLGLALLTVWIACLIRCSRFGYGLLAIREDEDTARMLGVPTERYKLACLLVSALLTGCFGAAFAYSLGFVNTGSLFRPDLGLDMVVFSLLGGAGTVFGPIVGAALMTVLTQVVLGGLLRIHLLVTGLLVVALVLLLPRGILDLLPARRRSRAVVAAPAPPTAVPHMVGDILELRGLTVQFRGLKAMDGVSLAVPAGSLCSVIGPNGAGKSTLFNAVTGYVRPSSGAVLFNGRRIDRVATYRLSRMGIGRAFQIAKPFPGMTVFDNVLVGALFGRAGRRDPEAVAADALRLGGLADLAGEAAASLPVGHLRRLELARVIATRPVLLLADEPCAGLNATETLDVIAVLDEARRRGMTVLLVEHDMATVMRVSDWLFVIAAGANVADGPPAAMARHPKVIEAYLGHAAPATGA
jgi:branched-chain amino acid transport system permease protein